MHSFINPKGQTLDSPRRMRGERLANQEKATDKEEEYRTSIEGS